MLYKVVLLKLQYCFSILFLIALFSFGAHGQYHYSKADTKAIHKNRVAGVAAFQNSDRNAHYRIGLFFESIYKRYNDTSIHAAMRHYRYSVLSEGEIDEESPKAAFQLGRIYEKGIGTPVDYDKALAYYMVSGEMGTKYQEEIVNRICPLDSVLANSIFVAGQSRDSVVIRFHPFCKLGSTATMATLSELATYLKANPDLNVKLSVAGPYQDITSYYNYWVRVEAANRICQQIRTYLINQNVSITRFSYLCHEAEIPSTEFKLIIELVPEKDNN